MWHCFHGPKLHQPQVTAAGQRELSALSASPHHRQPRMQPAPAEGKGHPAATDPQANVAARQRRPTAPSVPRGSPRRGTAHASAGAVTEPRRRRSAGLGSALPPLLRPIHQSGPGAHGRAATRLRFCPAGARVNAGGARTGAGRGARGLQPGCAAPLLPLCCSRAPPRAGSHPSPLRGRLERGRWRRGTGSTPGPRGNAEGSCAGTGDVLACVWSGGRREFSGTQWSLQRQSPMSLYVL